MTSKFLRLFLAAAVFFAISAMAQTSSLASSATGSAPAAALPSAPGMAAPVQTVPTKVGTINIQEAIFGSNEGRREMEALSKKYEPKQTELKGQNDELQALKKQLDDTGSKLNDDALANLKKQIEEKQKVFDRSYQDFQEEAGNAQQDVATKILKKMAPMIVKYSQDNGFTLIVDTSKPWPQSPVLWWGEAIDITKAVVDGYNAQSGVAAPASGASAKPAAPRTGTGSAKPAAGSTLPSAPKPQ
jgi:outer membrane protein